MHRDGRAAAGPAVDLGGVGDFFDPCRRRGVLDEFPEARSGVGIAPGGGLDFETIEPLTELVLVNMRRQLHRRGSSGRPKLVLTVSGEPSRRRGSIPAPKASRRSSSSSTLAAGSRSTL